MFYNPFYPENYHHTIADNLIIPLYIEDIMDSDNVADSENYVGWVFTYNDMNLFLPLDEIVPVSTHSYEIIKGGDYPNSKNIINNIVALIINNTSDTVTNKSLCEILKFAKKESKLI